MAKGKFGFQAKDNTGKLVTGVVEASSIAEARTILRSQELVPINVRMSNDLLETRLTGGVSAKELQIFSRQFSVLIESGVPVVESLQSIADSVRNKKFKSAILDIIRQVTAGRKLSEAMELYPAIFSKLYVNLIKAGESAGVLDEVLNRLAVYIEKSNALRSKITGALWYPAITIFIAFAAITVILIYVIPKMQTIFSDQGQELPELTRMVIDLSQFIRDSWLYGLIILLGTPILLLIYYRTPPGRFTIDSILLRIPVLGGLLIKSCIARMARTLATLLKAGVQLVEAIDIASEVTGNAVVERDLKKSKDSIIQGRNFVDPLRKSSSIPLMVTQMIAIGEETGNIDLMLTKIADFYETEVETTADALTSLIEPLIIVFLGGTIGFLVIAMFLPIFNMAGAVAG